MDEDTITCVLQPCCVPENPTNEDAKKMAKSVLKRILNPDLKVANEGGGLRHLNSDEKTQPLVALSKIGARLEREVQPPLNAQILTTLTQMQVSIDQMQVSIGQMQVSSDQMQVSSNQMQVSIDQMKISIERVENNQKELVIEVMNTKARKANKNALSKYREDPDDSTALKKLRTCANVVHIDFPETIGDLKNLSVVRLRNLNTAYRFCSPNLMEKQALYTFFSQFIQLDE